MSRNKVSKASNGRKEWTACELKLILDPNGPSDEELADRLGRSVAAIQSRRTEERKRRRRLGRGEDKIPYKKS